MNKFEKLKPQYLLSRQETHTYHKIRYSNYVARRNKYMRKFSCKQEYSMAVMHIIEYNVQIRAKRCKGLPDPWDDYFAKDLTYKSWKDRTKRNCQYYKIKKTQL